MNLNAPSLLKKNIDCLKATNDFSNDESQYTSQMFQMRKGSSMFGGLNNGQKTAGRNRLQSDYYGNEISDLENYWSNKE